MKQIKVYDFQNSASLINMASTLKEHIVSQKLFVPVKGKNYVLVEGWQFAGGLTGVFPRVTSLENQSTDKEIKYRAEVELVHMKSGQVVGTGMAVCSNKERGKQAFEEYAIASMAQTRAVGKAFRLTFGWVMKMAGYEATPAEEVIVSEDEEEKIEEETIFNLARSVANADLENREQFYKSYEQFIENKDELKKILSLS